ncbi:MAG: FtsQ-type POTRA domain-containing protein [Rhodospirillales bacterium]|nr:FtsQ-type POTRA domain-containing protein [Alphaproteobacteria bacterium]USO04604.1 MAG: FtsQ-type POTRA domain-containing protein [Rhodospirillales bacterium]
MSAGAGFSVRNVLVEGREYTDSEALKAIVNVQKGDPLFAFNPKAAQEAVEKLSWVRSVHVERRLPDTVYLRLTERKPLALWQRKGKLSVIDEEGTVLTSYKLERFQDLIILVGEDAPVHAQALLEVLEVEPEIKEMVEAATFVSDRRWDLKLKTGVIVKLPEEELGLALRRLSFTHREEGLLKKDVRSIDLRDPNKITVRTHPGAVQEYKAGFNPAAGGDI